MLTPPNDGKPAARDALDWGRIRARHVLWLLLFTGAFATAGLVQHLVVLGFELHQMRPGYLLVPCAAGSLVGYLFMRLQMLRERQAENIEQLARRDAELELLNQQLEARVEERTRQLHATQAELIEAQKMEAIGLLAGGVAHDFNNQLHVIGLNCELLMADMEPGSPEYDSLRDIEQAEQDATALTRQLLAFGRRQLLRPQVLDMNELLRGMQRLIRRGIPETIEVSTVFGADLWNVNVDPTQLRQVIMNLAINARDATMERSDGARLTIETRNVEIASDQPVASADLPDGRYVLIMVSDNGMGMDQETQERLFEPFYTTKDKGTGLGLSTVHGIVKQSQGHIHVHSVKGEGTVFEVYLAEAPDDQPIAERPPRQASRLGGGETILLVEDEEGVRKSIARSLERGGYRVLTADSGAAALDIARTRGPDAIALMLTDVVMPEMTGDRLALEIEPILPHTRVLFMSGYTADAIAQDGVLNADVDFIQKPFAQNELATRIREILAR